VRKKRRESCRQAGSRCELAAAGLSNNSTPNDIKKEQREMMIPGAFRAYDSKHLGGKKS
jgi:hypothetical protein